MIAANRRVTQSVVRGRRRRRGPESELWFGIVLYRIRPKWIPAIRQTRFRQARPETTTAIDRTISRRDCRQGPQTRSHAAPRRAGPKPAVPALALLNADRLAAWPRAPPAETP